jgi:hypothetical protein
MEQMRRLPGRSIRHFGLGLQRNQLWLAESHVLYREISVFQEEVKRFYYRDIQAVVCTPTRTWHACSWLAGSLLVFLAICGGVSAYLGYMIPFAMAWMLATVALAILLGNLVLGPSCATTLYTAAAEAPLYSLGRKRSAEKAIARIAVMVQHAQKDMEEVPQGTDPRPSDVP